MTYLPFADVSINPLTILTIGLMVGIFESVFGTLANLLIVPALSIFGLPLSIAASTSTGKSFGQTSSFLFNGNKDGLALRRVGAVAGIAGVPGVLLGFKAHLLLVQNGSGGDLFRLFYVALLLSASVVIFRQWNFFNRNDYYEDAPFPPFGLNWKFPLAVPGGSGLTHITPARVALVGFLLGAGTGMSGLGAGVLGIPLFMYALGLPFKNAAATDSVAMLAIGSATLLCYATAGLVEFSAVLILLASVTIGSRIGSLFPGELNLSHAKLGFSLLLAVSAICMAISLEGSISPRPIMFLAGATFCASLAVFSLVPEKFWTGKITRLLKRG